MNKVNTLFLIDDDEIYQFLTQKVIESTRLVDQIKVFSNGQEAIDFLKYNEKDPSFIPDVILLDLSMPIMDGWQFLDEFALLKPSLGKKVTIYVVSSSISASDIQKAKAISDVTDYIIKPVTVNGFIELINRMT